MSLAGWSGKIGGECTLCRKF